MTAKILAFPKLSNTVVAEVPPNAILAEPKTECAVKRRRRGAASKLRTTQNEVVCKRVPRRSHTDLRAVEGVLTIDWKGDKPWTMTFDPLDEGILNVVAPVQGMRGHGDDETHIVITTDEGDWTFVPVSTEY
jgi:hypothetical protein